jgi:2-polyprenyl-3-methyl-5-hydroxy-6-metoxy-1,4-benzoquinol methylase
MRKPTVLIRLSQRVRWRLGCRVAAPELEFGTDSSISQFYAARVTECDFVADPGHYEYPRSRWILEAIRGGKVLEVGCGNGGMTRLLAGLADRVVALDVSAPSLEQVRSMALPNVEVVQSLIEGYRPTVRFDWIVMSEVLEHLRRPSEVVKNLADHLAPGGSLLITTPNGHWESNEHLHEFSMESFAGIMAQTEAEQITVRYLRDRNNRRRWLTALIQAPPILPSEDDFESRSAIAKLRRFRFSDHEEYDFVGRRL